MKLLVSTNGEEYVEAKFPPNLKIEKNVGNSICCGGEKIAGINKILDSRSRSSSRLRVESSLTLAKAVLEVKITGYCSSPITTAPTTPKCWSLQTANLVAKVVILLLLEDDAR